ncbi:hypothetical protein AKO1_004312, partial [Acrasis kona]
MSNITIESPEDATTSLNEQYSVVLNQPSQEDIVLTQNKKTTDEQSRVDPNQSTEGDFLITTEYKKIKDETAFMDKVLVCCPDALKLSLKLTYGIDPIEVKHTAPSRYVISLFGGPTKNYHVVIHTKDGFLNFQKKLNDWVECKYQQGRSFKSVLSFSPRQLEVLPELALIVKDFPWCFGTYTVSTQDRTATLVKIERRYFPLKKVEFEQTYLIDGVKTTFYVPTDNDIKRLLNTKSVTGNCFGMSLMTKKILNPSNKASMSKINFKVCKNNFEYFDFVENMWNDSCGYDTITYGFCYKCSTCGILVCPECAIICHNTCDVVRAPLLGIYQCNCVPSYCKAPSVHSLLAHAKNLKDFEAPDFAVVIEPETVVLPKSPSTDLDTSDSYIITEDQLKMQVVILKEQVKQLTKQNDVLTAKLEKLIANDAKHDANIIALTVSDATQNA